MEILKILEENGKDLYIEDLDFFVTELATGGHYDDAYQEQCRNKIRELRAWLDGENTEDEYNPKNAVSSKAESKLSGPMVGIKDIAPKEAVPAAESLTPMQIIFSEIQAIRSLKSYKTNFKKYIAGKPEIDSAFVDTHYSFFHPWELDAIISVKQMDEEFIEKYFDALDHDKIAHYQQFSEAFFIKHFSQLDASIVLENGKNEWRKKENRSKQLDVFLRLKGVKI